MLAQWQLDPDLVAIILAALALLLLLKALLLLVLWRRARARALRAEGSIESIRRAALAAEAEARDGEYRLRTTLALQEGLVVEATALAQDADGAAVTAAADPAAGGRRVRAVAERTRALLADLRRIADVIGYALPAGGSEGDGSVDRQPATVEALLESYRADGLEIELGERGESFALRPGAAAAVHRVLDAALGNSLRHGGPGTRVALELVWQDDDLRLDVADDGARNRARLEGLDPDAAVRSSEHLGLGSVVRELEGPTLTVLRDAVHAFGGALSAQETPGVGFVLRATFPGLRGPAARRARS